MSKRADPNSPVAIADWVNSESEIELVNKGMSVSTGLWVKLGR